MVNTTIKLSETTKKDLDKIKIHPRQPYDEVVKKLIKIKKEVEGGVK